MLLRSVVLAFSIFVPLTAQAQTTTGPAGASHSDSGLLRAESPAAIAALMQEMGYRAELTTDSQGDPKIESAASGANFTVYFYGCKGGRNCNSIQFSSGFDAVDGVEMNVVNDWNRHNRFGQVSLDETNDPFIEMDIAMQGGLPRDLFKENLSIWDNMLADFQRHIDW